MSVKEKALLKGSGGNQGDERKRTIDEVSKSGDVVKTGDSSRSAGGVRRIPAYCPGGVRHKDGMTSVPMIAFCLNGGKIEDQYLRDLETKSSIPNYRYETLILTF